MKMHALNGLFKLNLKRTTSAEKIEEEGTFVLFFDPDNFLGNVLAGTAYSAYG